MNLKIKKAILNFLNAQLPGKILDIPAGSGWLQSELSSEWEYHGSDLYTSPEIKNFTQADLNQNLPYEDHSFGYILCAEGLEHIENYHHVLREFSRILIPGGSLMITTPNPLNIKSRHRYYWEGTFYGFPHLLQMPKEGDHLHMSPIHFSFLTAFAKKYGFESYLFHPIEIKKSNYRFVVSCLWLKVYNFWRYFFKSKATKIFMQQLVDWNLLLSDHMVISFRKTMDVK